MSAYLNNNTLQDSFDELIDSYIENMVGIADHFLSEQLAGDLKSNLTALFARSEFYQAGIGNTIALG